jgi:hypothetical protein
MSGGFTLTHPVKSAYKNHVSDQFRPSDAKRVITSTWPSIVRGEWKAGELAEVTGHRAGSESQA